MIVEIYTDGSSLKNPGPGGWAAIFKAQGRSKVIYGYDEETTNNKMELTAAIKALEHLKWACEVELYTDSQYVFNGITNWVHKWMKNGWQALNFCPIKKRYDGFKPVQNVELWKSLVNASSRHRVKYVWVRGHDDTELNIQCDLIAREAARRKISGCRELHASKPVSETQRVLIPEDLERCITFD